jgi:hypothetical protein
MRTIDFTTFGHRSSFARDHFYKKNDLNFAVNRKCEKVRERSKTGSRTPTSGAGRDKFARGGEKI